MCLTAPARVIAVDGAWATVEWDGVQRRASSLPAPEVRRGDWVIVAAGSVIRIIPSDLAREIATAVAAVSGDDSQQGEGEAS